MVEIIKLRETLLRPEIHPSSDHNRSTEDTLSCFVEMLVEDIIDMATNDMQELISILRASQKANEQLVNMNLDADHSLMARNTEIAWKAQ